MNSIPKAACIILNWNGWRDTIECLESIFHLTGCHLRVIVCDNASSDGSVEKIKQWARGELAAESANRELSGLISPPVPKPIPYLELSREQAEAGSPTSDVNLVLIQNGANLGFAGGNNVGLRYGLADVNCQFFWLLNNDTVVKADALSALLRYIQQRPEVGLCGSLNLSYHEPSVVQAQGGKTYRRWTARVRVPPRLTIDHLDSRPEHMDYVNGAAMLASRQFLDKIGLMDESYFLYFEELDWAMRAAGKFKLDYARESVIYHKDGASIGSNTDRTKRSLLSDKYLSRNRVLFTRRFLPWALPSVLAWVCLAAAYRLCRGDMERAKAMFKWALKGLRA